MLPRFYDPAFVNERDLALIQVASKSSWAFPQVVFQDFCIFQWFPYFQGHWLLPEKVSAGPLSRWLRSQWQAVVWSGTNKFFLVHNCYYCQPRGQFGSRKAQVSDGKFWHFNWQQNQPAADQPWTVRWTLMRGYVAIFPSHCLLLVWFYWFGDVKVYT